MVTFNRRTNASDEKFLSGDKVHKGTLGPNRERDPGFDAFQAKLREVRILAKDFSGSRTFNDVANMSQMKIDQAHQAQSLRFQTMVTIVSPVIFWRNIVGAFNGDL